MPRLLLEYASGKKAFVRFTCIVRPNLLLTRFVQARGAVLGAVSAANTTFGSPIELLESLELSDGTASPYIKRSPVLASYAKGLTKIPVPESLGVPEAASLFDVWMKDKTISRGNAIPSFFA
jgi:small subunit ribosomal protein S29